MATPHDAQVLPPTHSHRFATFASCVGLTKQSPPAPLQGRRAPALLLLIRVASAQARRPPQRRCPMALLIVRNNGTPLNTKRWATEHHCKLFLCNQTITTGHPGRHSRLDPVHQHCRGHMPSCPWGRASPHARQQPPQLPCNIINEWDTSQLHERAIATRSAAPDTPARAARHCLAAPAPNVDDRGI